MNCFFNITLLPDAEMAPTVLMNAIYAKFHKVLCDLKSTSIGISFPKYQVTLGNILRVHGCEFDLKKNLSFYLNLLYNKILLM
jgi:CRISPR-associated endonuclease Csy4